MRLEDLNVLDAAAAIRELLRCCGSRRWAERMAAARPFSSIAQLTARADSIWHSLDRRDWLEAFAAHPRIGGESGASGAAGLADPDNWSEQEQAGTRLASDRQRERLLAQNREYEARFGHIFIVCAAGKSAGEMLARLEERLTNDPDQELRVAAEEQRKITHLRLAKLLAE
jgi:OHCU decarboxylase